MAFWDMFVFDSGMEVRGLVYQLPPSPLPWQLCCSGQWADVWMMHSK